MPRSNKTSYASSGVSIKRGDQLVDIIKPLARTTFRKEVIGSIGGFAAASFLPKKYKNPVLISCTDGVGTKIEIAEALKVYDSIGIDLVAMCVNDLVVQGAKPLFFLDYIAVGKLEINKAKKILKGIFQGCKISKCKLIGGETAEMPGVYSKNKFDLAGFSVGIVSKKKILSKKNVKNKDIILAIPSNGIHSNGYSLVRKIIDNKKINKTMKNELLKPTKIYSEEVLNLTKKNLISSAAHITGGGLIENLLRSIPENMNLNIDLSKIKISKIFKWLKKNNISDSEMLRTFNCGIGFCIIAPEKNVKKIKKQFSKNYIPYEIGYISKNKKKVNIIENLKW